MAWSTNEDRPLWIARRVRELDCHLIRTSLGVSPFTHAVDGIEEIDLIKGFGEMMAQTGANIRRLGAVPLGPMGDQLPERFPALDDRRISMCIWIVLIHEDKSAPSQTSSFGAC
ncbi:MAG: hypothetical protein NTW19_20005 [Planctomycetota bacterium]|nr:hypothetical protein [Planctomycetota bacterium]